MSSFALGPTNARSILIAATTVSLMIGAVLLGLNLEGGEESIEQSIARLQDTQDRQFDRGMGMLLGPAIFDGNRFDVLLNRGKIFPAMLAGIRDAERSDELGTCTSPRRSQSGVPVRRSRCTVALR